MKKIYIITFLVLTFMSCKSMLVNLAMSSMGIYNEDVSVHQFKGAEKRVVFIPMKHLAPENFYNNVAKQVDSLKKNDFIFYTEQVIADGANDTTIRKFRKITGIPLSQKGYKFQIDSVINADGKIKFKKKLVDQPKYIQLGINDHLNINTDVTIESMVEYYELKYGSVNLEACDFETEYYKESICDDKKIGNSKYSDLIINFRNLNVLQHLDTDTNTKIAIIYGEHHFAGIKEGLLARGYKKVEPIK